MYEKLLKIQLYKYVLRFARSNLMVAFKVIYGDSAWFKNNITAIYQ